MEPIYVQHSILCYKVKLMSQIKWKDLKIQEQIGSGGCGIVYRGTYRKVTVAVKQLIERHDLSKNAQEEFNKELEMMMQLQSPNVIKFIGYCSAPDLAMVMEFMPKGSLCQVNKNEAPLPWKKRKQIAIDITNGLHFLHSKNILHRDIKSLNVLLNENFTAKLCDFGLATVKKETMSIMSSKNISLTPYGTIPWMAPELFVLKPIFSKQSDIYALGMTFWEIAARKVPYFEQLDRTVIMQEVKNGQREEIPANCPEDFAKIIRRCWSADPKERPSTEDILALLRDWNAEEEVYELKIVFLGVSSVGKTALSLRIIGEAFNESSSATLCFNFSTMTVVDGDKKIILKFWDTAGQERFHSLISSYTRDTHGMIIVYDITQRDSFENVEEIVKKLEADGDLSKEVLLIANKCDKESLRQVTEEEGKALADRLKFRFIETSAKEDSEIDKKIIQWSKELCKKYPQQAVRRVDSIVISKKKKPEKSNPLSSCCSWL